MSLSLYHDDCLTVLKALPDHSVDAVITDPPYLATDLHFDKDPFSYEWLHELVRVVKPDGYLVVFAPVLMAAQIAQVWSLRFTGAWVKPQGGMRTHSAKKPMNQWELYSVFAHPDHQIKNLTWNKVTVPGEPYRKVQRNSGYKRGGKDQLDRADSSTWTTDGYVSENAGTRQLTDVLYGPAKSTMKHAERTIHPTQKPVVVLSTLVQWVTNEGDTVLDPFMGSGSTGVAALQNTRHFIGIEKDRSYYEIACQRIALHED
jgi:site-specific DNA-methyltransferase (adenine-specific)